MATRLRLAAWGLVVGLGGALAAGRVLGKLLYGVGAMDAGTFAGTAAMLIAVALAASYLPARRATRVNPITALRAD